MEKFIPNVYNLMTYFSSPDLTDWQKQIIIGTIIGGSSIVKPPNGRNCYLFMRSKNYQWLNYKSQELKDFTSQQPFTKEGNTLRWHSNCYPVFNKFRDLFYDESKKKVLKMGILDMLRDIGLAIWYGDCGDVKNDVAILKTSRYGEEGTNMICRYFNEVGIKVDKIKKRDKFNVSLTKESTQKFFTIIGHRLPDFMHNKLI